ncbi:MAG: DMT family transporter [Chloroflexi bacterium]|nr:DMT family transporter [Chloroflexota bacterium]
MPVPAAPHDAHPRDRLRSQGITAALTSAFFLGMAPVFGKQAILAGAAPLAVVALRTTLAAALLLAAMAAFKRQYLFIYPAGLLGCLLAGWINGFGSLFYYSALGRIDASVGHMLYSLYPLFLAVWLSLDKQPPGRLTVFRIILAIPAIFLLTQAGHGRLDWIGVLEMLAASALYALHIPINQRVLFDMPAPTVTLYTLIAMSAVVLPVFLFSASGELPQAAALAPILALTLVTFLSRLMLFAGVKQLGGMQTALLGLSELLVAVFLSIAWLGESLTWQQWLGAALLVASLLLVVLEKSPLRRPAAGGWLSWLRPGLPGDIQPK